MTDDPGNTENRQTDDPLPIERREAAAGPSAPPLLDSPLAFRNSEAITTYSATSSIRSPGKLFAGLFADMWQGRELAWRLFLRNIRGLYRQTLLGLFWVFLPPIANTAIWIFLKEAGVFETGKMDVNSTVYILTGMILWQSFIDAFQMPLGMLNKNRNMLSKLNFPRESLLMVGFGEVVLDLLVRMLLLVPAFLWFEVQLHATLLLAPFAMLALILLGTALGLLIMPWGSLYQDVERFIGMATPLWMILTPIIYLPLESFPGSLLNWLNPASPILILARDWMLVGTASDFAISLTYCLIALPLVVLGLAFYRISIPVLVERMSA